MPKQRSEPVPPSPVPYFINNTTTSGSTTPGTWKWIVPEPASNEEPHGPLYQIQKYLQEDRFPWLGGRVLSLRSSLWKLCR